jgi:DNA-binding MarR family transcriptional regulator
MMPMSKRPPPDPSASLLLLDKQLCFALYASSLAMTKLYKPLLAPLGLTYPQYLVMLVLWEHDGQSVNELGHALHLDSGTLTPLLKRMAQAGWVQRQRDPADERRVQVLLTSAGLALKDQAQGIPVTMSCQLGLNEPEIRALRETLQRFQLGLHNPTPPCA